MDIYLILQQNYMILIFDNLYLTFKLCKTYRKLEVHLIFELDDNMV